MNIHSENAISVRGLYKEFRGKRRLKNYVKFWNRPKATHALKAVDLEVAAGELVTLVGPNGAGKSTLLKTISSLIRPTEGSISVIGLDVATNAQKVRECVGYVLADERSFYWRLSCKENLRFFGALQGLLDKSCDRRIEELAAMFGLTQQLDRPFMDLSTGQRQRLAIARGLLADPPVVLFDEATRSLDPGRAERLRWIVREVLVNQKGKAVLFASHNLDEVKQISDRCALMTDGRLTHVGRFESIESEVRSAFAAEAEEEDEEFRKVFGATAK